MRYYFLLTLLLLNLSGVFAQKKTLDHSVYDLWKSMNGFQITDDGKFATYNTTVLRGDATLNVVDLSTRKTTTIQRGAQAKITNDGKFICFAIKPEYKKAKEAKDKKYKGDKIPKDSIGILNLATGKIQKFPQVKDFKIGEEASEYLAFKAIPKSDTSKKEKAKSKKSAGGPLVVYNLLNGKLDTLQNVTDYSFNKKGDELYIVQALKPTDSTQRTDISIYYPATKKYTVLKEGYAKSKFTLPSFSEDGKALAFYWNADTTKKADESLMIYFYKAGADSSRMLVSNKTPGIKEGWHISKDGVLAFNKDNNRLFFGVAPILPQKDTSLVESDLVKVDIWNYQDKYLQPQQLQRLKRDQQAYFLSHVSIDNPSNIVQLATEEYPTVKVGNKWNADWAYSLSSERYAIQSQWNANPINDLYIISVSDGKSKLLKQGEYISQLECSPDGNYLAWYDNEKKHWFIYDKQKDQVRNATESIKVPLWNEIHDSPSMADAYGNGSWIENDLGFFIYDKYDVWQIDPSGVKQPFMITEGIGRAKGLTLREQKAQIIPRESDKFNDPIKKDATIYFLAFDNTTKGYGFYEKNLRSRTPLMRQLILEPDYTLGYFNKAKEANVITFVKSNFQTSPDLYVTKDAFRNATKLSDINPQQSKYNWGTVELVKWNSRDGKELEGLVYKPEDFDPNKKYPMVAYFYERNSETKNAYRNPAPSRSIINITYFASNGYIVFVPDIIYTTGQPGDDAMNCIMPGVEMLCKNSWIDKDKLGIQGQSWGGYQVAYMVTKTDMFRAAGAGAPVANMTSAYGGIRWGSGMSRQFQYEHTQSRLGKTLWDEGGLELYIKNSPLFGVDKIKTPLLIMSNDADDAVPWYQGIEFFTALKRLGKEAFLVQYNNEKHNLVNDVNTRDYSIRLSQFFDHYLKGQPMPVWMKKGVPAIKKGIDWGLELVPEEKIVTTIQTQEKI